jgi:hypothetical protein
MPFVDLLSADTALVKTFTLNHNVIEKSPYPMVRDFTSHRREVTDLRSLLGVLEEGANKGWCMSKGSLKKQIVNESRAGATDANEGTQVLILDLDGLECMDIDDALNRCGLGNFSHVIQWSASAWITNPIPTTEKTRSPATSPNTSVVSPKGSTATISGHTLVDGSTSPQGPSALAASQYPYIRDKGHTYPHWRSPALAHRPVSRRQQQADLHRPSSLLGGLQPPSPAPTITLVERDYGVLPTTLFTVNPQEVAQERQKLLSDLREKAGLKRIKDSQFTVPEWTDIHVQAR